MKTATNESLTEQTVEKLRLFIQEENLSSDAPLPSENSLRQRFDLSRVTIRRALKILKDQGLIISLPGKGYFLAGAKAISSQKKNKTEILYVHNVGLNSTHLDVIRADVYHGISQASRELGLDAYLSCLESHRLQKIILKKSKEELLGVLFDWNDKELAKYFLKENIPFVVVEGDFDELPVGSVVQDDKGGTMVAMEYFFSLGHTRIAYLGNNDYWVHHQRRICAYREFYLRQNIPIDENIICLSKSEKDTISLRKIKKLLTQKEVPTAIFVANRELLCALLSVVNNLNLSIPEDLSIIVWGNQEPGDEGEDISHIEWDRQEMGRLAARMLEDRARRNAKDKMQVLIPAKLVHRKSTVKKKET